MRRFGENGVSHHPKSGAMGRERLRTKAGAWNRQARSVSPHHVLMESIVKLSLVHFPLHALSVLLKAPCGTEEQRTAASMDGDLRRAFLGWRGPVDLEDEVTWLRQASVARGVRHDKSGVTIVLWNGTDKNDVAPGFESDAPIDVGDSQAVESLVTAARKWLAERKRAA